MTDIVTTGNETRRRPGMFRAKKLKVKIDMTPMVDLGFLLIAFFVMTTQMNKPSTLKLNMPTEQGPPLDLGQSDALTVLLDANDRIYYYHGDWKDAVKTGQIFQTNFSEANGLGKVIREKQKWLDVNNKKEGRNGLMLLIKPGKDASYQNVIDALDEAMINIVKKYALLKTEPEETEWIRANRK